MREETHPERSLRGISSMDRLITVLLYAAAILRPGYSLLATNKLSLASWGSYNQRENKGSGTYSYGYDIQDPVTGNIQFKHEERHPNGTVTGSYGYVDGNGQNQVTNYVSDVNGYRVVMRNPEGFPTQAPPQLADAPALPIHQLFFPAEGGHVGETGEPNRVVNPPPILYQLQGPPPFLTYYRAHMPFFFRRK